MAGPVALVPTPPWVTALFYGILGLLFGILAERTTYCIVVATHQVMGVRYSAIYEMILTGVAVSALLDGLLVFAGVVPPIDAFIHVPGAGWFTVIGGFIFGLGIVLGQGCMVGMLWKSGQGYLVNWFEILGMVVGTIIFAYPIFNGLDLSWWWHSNTSLSIANGSPANYTPMLLSWAGGISVRYAALAMGIVFFAAIMLPTVLWLRRNRVSWSGSGGISIFKSPYFYGTLFGLFMVASFVFLAGRGFNYLGVTTPIGLFAEYLTAPFGVVLGSPTTYPNWLQTVAIANVFTFFILMVMAGALVSSLWRGTFSLRLPSPTTNQLAELGIGFLGGVILAIGARMAQGCSVGAFWSGLAALSLFGITFTMGFIPGTIAGYYTYVALSSRAARRSRGRGGVSTVVLRAGDLDATGLIVTMVISLILAAIGLEIQAFNTALKVHMAPAQAAQWMMTMEALAVLVLALGILGWYRTFVRGRRLS